MGGLFSSHELIWDDIPTSMDGWYVSHESIRQDMKDIRNAFEECHALSQQGKLDDGTVNDMWSFWKHFEHTVHGHHDHEEKIFFPWLETRVKLPEKMSSDHVTLINNLNTINEKFEVIKDSPHSAGDAEFDELLKAWDDMSQHMLEHLKEEEDVGMPMVRKNFNPTEYLKTSDQITAHMEWYEICQLLRWMELEDRRRWMNIHKIPWFVQRFILEPRFPRYEKEFRRNLYNVHEKAVENGVATK